MPYIKEVDTCGACIEVCPWSQDGHGPLTALLHRQRARVTEHWPSEVPKAGRLLALAPEPDEPPLVPAPGGPEDWWREVEIAARHDHPGDLVELDLVRAGGADLPDWSAEAHVELRLPSARLRAYSLANLPGEGRNRLGIKVETDGTGVSAKMATPAEGQRLIVSSPGNNLLVPENHARYLLSASGIGITVIAALTRRLSELGRWWTGHDAVKSKDQALYADELRALPGGLVHVHTSRDWLEDFPGDVPADTAVVMCGPTGFMDAVRQRSVQSGIEPGNVYEVEFGSGREDRPFDLVLASSGEAVRVEPGQTVARALGRRGIHVPVSCGYGIYGACTVGLLEGEQDARDKIFTKGERRTRITLCCSRAKGDRIVVVL
jgi:vanillate O-demethylase ferredoxin subunit